MLKFLNIKNLILIDSCEVEFHPGLNILSGETGAGKTALLEAISLLSGARADTGSIRHGADKAVIEGGFEIANTPLVIQTLQEAGVECDPTEYLILRREISRSGKNKALINCQMVPLPLLGKVGALLIDIVSQHSHQELRTSEKQRGLIDLFAGAREELLTFQKLWHKGKELSKKLAALKEELSLRERLLETCLREEREIEEASLKAGEEELLFEEYNRLANIQELTEKTTMITEGIQDFPAELARYKGICQELSQLDPLFKESTQLLHEASIAIKETYHSLAGYLGQLEYHPRRFDYLEERLKLLDKLKRKYGNPLEYLETLKTRSLQLGSLDLEMEATEAAHREAEANTALAAANLSLKRKNGAALWSQELTHTLHSLNMPHALLQIQVREAERTLSGEDAIEFWLKPNQGEEPISVKESASGGELARLLFSIKTTLATRNGTPTLIFDEIDANVGGKTASIIGAKLHGLGECRQVVCITHFSQVALYADHHFSVSKEEQEGRTVATVTYLDQPGRDKEVQRMLGISEEKTLLKNAKPG